jgi:hypothetical protein
MNKRKKRREGRKGRKDYNVSKIPPTELTEFYRSQETVFN